MKLPVQCWMHDAFKGKTLLAAILRARSEEGNLVKCVRGKRRKRISACKPVRSFNLKPIQQCAAEAREKTRIALHSSRDRIPISFSNRY